MKKTHLIGVCAVLVMAGCAQLTQESKNTGGPGPEPPVFYTAQDQRSAIRFEGETYEQAEARHDKLVMKHQPERSVPLLQASATVKNSKVAVADADLSKIPVWSDADIKAHFEYSRDLRFQTMSGGAADFLRRLSWLYPDDGCYARAELVCTKAAEANKVRPYKLFSFGNLSVKTTNSSKGYVSWWYHVVPVVKSATTQEPMVLDAAIDPSKPLPWKDWLLKQVPSLASVRVTVADSNAYSPDSPAFGGANEAAQAKSAQEYTFLKYEWDRQVALGRDPYKVLGDAPPWTATPSDTTPPTASITTPEANSTLTGTVTLSATATDNVGVTKVDFYLGTTLVGSDSTSPYSLAWDSKTLANGAYNLTCRALDAAGNVGTSESIPVTVSNTTTGVSEVEPNNTSSTAQALTSSGALVKATLASSTDVDFFVVDLAAGKSLTVSLSPNASSDYDLYVYNSSMVLVGSSEKPKGMEDAVTVTNTGTTTLKRYLKVVYYSGLSGANGAYDLKATF